MVLQLIEHSDTRSFSDAVLHHLLESEAEYCAHIGLILRLRDKPYMSRSDDELECPLLLTVQNRNRVELAALQTLKKQMLVTRGSDKAMRCLADGLAARNWNGDSIIGSSPSAGILAGHYARRSGRSCRLTRRLRTFQLTAVAWPATVRGSMRLCTPSDRALAAKFIAAFSSDIAEPLHTQGSAAMAARLIDDRRIFFWVDREPVAMAAWAGRTPNGIRINSVYTPPEFRRRGYATSLVAHLTQRMLDEGRKFCFLHTDQANPTSNNIYQKIGYAPVCDSEWWEFGRIGGG